MIPPFSAQDWVYIVQGIGIVSVFGLIVLYLLGWKIWPAVWPVWKSRMEHSMRQLDSVMEKRERDQDRFLDKLSDLQRERSRQMERQTTAITTAIHEKDTQLVEALGEVRASLQAIEKRIGQ